MKIAFVLTIQGSLNRFEILRRFMERERLIDARWILIRLWSEGDLLRFLPGRWPSRIRALLDSRSAFSDRRLDAVVFHAHLPFIAFVWYSWLLRRRTLSVWCKDDPPVMDPVIASRYGTEIPKGWRSQIHKAFWRATFDRTGLIIGRCAYTKRLLVEELGITPDRIETIHFGIDLEQWPVISRSPRRQGYRAKLLFVASQFWRKGGDILLEAFMDGLSEHCELHIVSSDIMAQRAIQQANASTANRLFLYTGISTETAEMRRLFHDADIFVLPTRDDFAPFAVLEAMASSLPVISTHTGGIPELVEDGVTGCLVEAGDRQALYIAIERLLGDPQGCCRMGTLGRRRVEAAYDARANIPRIADLIRRAAHRAR